MRARRLVLPLLLAPACEGPESADVRVPWRFSDGDCASIGVREISAELFTFGDAEPAREARAACSAGALVLSGVEPGDYALHLVGHDAEGCATHEARVPAVKVRGHDRELAPVLLGLRARPLEIAWSFADGEDCAAHGVVQVQATIQVGDTAPVHGAWLCAAGQGRLPEMLAGPARLTLLGLDADGTTLARAQADFGESALLSEPCAPAFEAAFVLEGCASVGCP